MLVSIHEQRQKRIGTHHDGIQGCSTREQQRNNNEMKNARKQVVVMNGFAALFKRAVVGVGPAVATVAALGSTSTIVDWCCGY